jgi:hypothetical protein
MPVLIFNTFDRNNPIKSAIIILCNNCEYEKSFPTKSEVGLALASKIDKADIIADIPNDTVLLSLNIDDINDDVNDVIP